MPYAEWTSRSCTHGLPSSTVPWVRTQLHPIWRLRLITGAIVTAYMVGAFCLWPDPATRATNSYLFILTFGYGHLIGGAWFARQKMRAMYPKSISPHLVTAFLWIGLFNLCALYEWSIGAFGQWVVLAFFGASVWHYIENDLGLRKAYDENLNLNQVPRSVWYHLIPLGILALFVVFAAASLPELQPTAAKPILFGRIIAGGAGVLLLTQSGAANKVLGLLLLGGAFFLPSQLGPESPVQFADVFNMLILYHHVAWYIFFYDRGQKLPAAARRAMWKRILWVHLPPVALWALAALLPILALDAVLRWLLAPTVYLFWSVVHVAQTFVVRGIEPRETFSLEPAP